ncbi:MAG: YciI family protein [Planctomycetota bacterium]
MARPSQTDTQRPEFLCTLEPARAGMPENPTTEEQRVVSEHFAYYQSLHESGTLVIAGRTLEPPFRGLFVFRAADLAAAEGIVAADPAVAAGVMHASLQSFSVALIGSEPR